MLNLSWLIRKFHQFYFEYYEGFRRAKVDYFQNVNSLNQDCKIRSLIELQVHEKSGYSYHLLMLGVNFENEDLVSC